MQMRAPCFFLKSSLFALRIEKQYTEIIIEICGLHREEATAMYFAVTLEFDQESQSKMQEMIDEVARVTGCDRMKQENVPPHVTVCCLEGENEAVLLSEMEGIASSMSKSTLRFANIGVFNPLVIYLGPIMNEFLQNTCRTVNERLLQYAEVGNKGNYLPNRWVPHAGIAVKLTPEALKVAFDIVQEKFSPFEATVERIVLVKAEPYEELRGW